MTEDKITFSTSKGFNYHWSGRFIAPNENWIHMTRELTDYELVLVTEGSLAIECDGAEYVVNEGEYLIMSPCRQQKGTKNGYCSFYWVHFEAEEAGVEAGAESADTEINDTDNTENFISIRRQDICAYKERIIILLKELQDADKRYRDRTLNNYLTGALITELSLQGSVDMSFKTSRSQEQLNSDIKTYIS